MRRWMVANLVGGGDHHAQRREEMILKTLRTKEELVELNGIEPSAS